MNEQEATRWGIYYGKADANRMLADMSYSARPSIGTVSMAANARTEKFFTSRSEKRQIINAFRDAWFASFTANHAGFASLFVGM